MMAGPQPKGKSVIEIQKVLLLVIILLILLLLWLDSPIWAWASSFRRGFTITHFRHITLGRTPLDEGPARRRDLYLTKHNTQKR
jgi:hypothetical protein